MVSLSLKTPSNTVRIGQQRSFDQNQTLDLHILRILPITKRPVQRSPTQCNIHSLPDAAGPSPSRRTLLQTISLTALSVPLLLGAASPPSYAQGTLITVGQDVQTIAEALKQAQDGDTILLNPGIYRERVILDKAVTITTAPASSSSSLQDVEIVWETDQPYESTIVCTVDGAVLKGPISIRHNSYSIANNYAVELINCGSGTIFEGCTISSKTGSGIGIEGGDPQIRQCIIKDCARSGVMVFSDLEGNPGAPKITDCQIENNKQHGVLVRDGAEPMVIGNKIQGNGGYGLALQGCSGEYKDNLIKENKKGHVAVHFLSDGLDAVVIAKENGLEMNMITDTTLKMM